MEKTAKTKPGVNISTEPGSYHPPKHELESLARCLYPAMIAYFESEEGKREFADWREKQTKTQ